MSKQLKRPAPLKTCPGCDQQIHVRYRVCPYCEYSYGIIEIQERKKKEQKDLIRVISLLHEVLDTCGSREKVIELLDLVLEFRGKKNERTSDSSVSSTD